MPACQNGTGIGVRPVITALAFNLSRLCELQRLQSLSSVGLNSVPRMVSWTAVG